MQLYEKDPDEVVWLGFTWNLGVHTLAGSTWVAPAGLTATDVSYQNTDGTFDADTGAAQVKVSGGTLGEVYELVNRITTSNGETFDDTLLVVMVTK